MFRRSRLIAAAAAATLLAVGLVATAQGRMVGSAPPQRDSGTAYFAVTHANSKSEFAAGNVSDKVFGDSAITYKLKLVSSKTKGSINVKATQVVLYTSAGSLTGSATATINNVSSKTQTITNGKLKLDKGFGALKGDQLIATFSGTANLTANQLKFTYKGTLTS